MSTPTRTSPAARDRLEPFRRALRLEAGAIATDPALLWQQMSNRLRQRDDLKDTVLAEEDRRLRNGSRAWFRVLSPLAESPQLLGTIAGHDEVALLGGSCLATLDAGTLTVWDGQSGRPAAAVGLQDCTTGGAFAVDAQATVVVTATPDGLLVHDLSTGSLLSHLEQSDEPPHEFDGSQAALALELGLVDGRLRRAFCVSPDGSLVAGAQSSGAVTVWDTSTGRIRRAFSEAVGGLSACAFTPDAATLVFAARDGTVCAWRHHHDADSDTLHATDSTGTPARDEDRGATLVLDIAIAPDGTFATTVTGTRVIVQDLPSGHRRWSQEHFGSGRCCAVSPDGHLVVTGGERGVLRLWDAATGTITGTLAGHAGTVDRCAISSDGSLLASAAPDGIKVWDLSVPGGSEFFDSHADRVTALAFSPDGEHIASAGADRRVLLWDSTSRRQLGSLDGHEDAVQDCAFTRADGSEIVTAGRDGTARLWDVAANEEKHRLADGLDPWWGCAVHPDGAEALLCGTGSIDRVALSSGERLATYPRDAASWRCRYAPDGTWAVVTGAAGRVAFWDSATERIIDVIDGGQLVGVCAVSPDGHFAVSGGEDGTVRVWDLPDRRERLVLRHDAAVWGCAVTADARYVVSTSWDRTLRIWNADTGLEVMRQDCPVPLHGCAAHPWLLRLAFGDHAGRVHIVEPVGLPFDPVVVTPRDEDGVLRVWCPSCRTVRDLDQADLGTVHHCACGLTTRVTDQPLRMTRPAEPGPDSAEGLARALGAQTPRAQVLMFSTKTCAACGHEFELLRHACPQCGSTAAMPPDVEAMHFMQMRQVRASELVNRGALLFQSGDLDEAEATLRQAVEANPWNATACGNLGVVLLHRGLKEESLEWFETAVGIDPDVPGGREMVVQLRTEVPQRPSGETEPSADDEVAAARTALVAQDMDGAILHFGRAIDLVERGRSCAAPTFNLYGERATAEAYRGDYRASLADLDRALELEPGEWHYLDARGRAHYVLGSYREAVADWSSALERLPATGDQRAGVLLYRAASYRQLDQPAEALADLRTADAACVNPAIAKGIEDLRRTINSEEGLG
jgi:WD40 repeat protein/tetratricopeptide (TPR) repeat protein